MKEKEITLKSYRKEIEVLTLEIDVPQYGYNDERRNYFYKYEDLLLKLFNNKRDNNEILKIQNYYGNNKIKVYFNLTEYIGNNNKEESIEHLKTWLTSNIDIPNSEIKQEIIKGYIYEIPEWENNIETYEGKDDDIRTICNFIEWGE